VFHKLRKEANVGILQGDQYSDDMWIKLKQLQKEHARITDLESNELPERDRQQWLEDISTALEPLLRHDTNANWQIAQYKQDIQYLQANLKLLIVILDFTKWNQPNAGNVQDLIAVLATGCNMLTLQQSAESSEKVLNGYDEVIIWSDGGPSHFKVYKTHSWMPKFAKMTNKVMEWNNFYPNRGHNIADSHAGHESLLGGRTRN